MKKLLIIVFFCIFTTSCAKIPSLFLGDRSYAEHREDSILKKEIKKTLKLADPEKFLFSDIKIGVFLGRLLLFGEVPNSYALNNLKDIISKIIGVKEIFIHVHNREDYIIKSSTKIMDINLATLVRSRLLLDIHTKNVNYDVFVRERIVYIHGITTSKSIAKRVAEIIARTKGVTYVISYISVIEER